MTTLRLPRPRTLDEVVDRLERVESNLGLVREGVHVLSGQIGGLAGEIASMRKAGAPPWRSAEASFHDFDPLVAEFRNTLRERVKDPNDRRFDSDRARAMVQNAIDGAKRDEKAARYDALRKTTLRIVIGVAVGVLVAMTLAHFGVHP